jgi:hypothetical protein
MTVNTGYTALTGADSVALVNTLRVYRRTIDFSVVNLASTGWFALFAVPAGSELVSGVVQITTLDAGGGKINLGIQTGSASGNEILDSQVCTSATAVKTLDHVQLATTAAGVIYLNGETAALTTAVVSITLLVQEPNANPAQG